MTSFTSTSGQPNFADFDYVGPFCNGLAVARRNADGSRTNGTSVFLIGYKGQPVTTQDYKHIGELVRGFRRACREIGGYLRWFFLDGAGQEAWSNGTGDGPFFDTIVSDFDLHGLARVVVNEETFYINRQGIRQFTNFVCVGEFRQNLAVAVPKGSSKSVYIDHRGQIAFGGAEFENAHPFENNLARVVSGGNIFYISRKDGHPLR